MNPSPANAGAFVEWITIANALAAALGALYTDGSTPVPSPTPSPWPAKVFDVVKVFRSPDIRAALQELLLFSQKACIIAPGSDTYRNTKDGLKMTTDLNQQFHLLLTDRVFGSQAMRMEAIIGNPSNLTTSQSGQGGTALGVLEMNRLVRNNLIGSGLGIPQCVVAFELGELLIPTEEDRQQIAGRECWHIELSIDSGRRVTFRK